MDHLKGSTVKVYQNVKTKYNYQGDGRIEEVIKQISDDLYICNCSFDESIVTYIIDINDLID